MKLIDLHNMILKLKENYPENMDIVASQPNSFKFLNITDRYFDQVFNQIVFITKEMSPKIQLGIWKNKKTGNLYEVTGTQINTTNDRDGDIMVEYKAEDNNKFIREINEFLLKFEKIHET